MRVQDATMKFNLKSEKISIHNGIAKSEFPKYTSQLMNLANQNGQGTRPKIVGQMSELFPQFLTSATSITATNWAQWYKSQKPNAVDVATEKVFEQIENLKQALTKINKDLVRLWIEDLLLSKTYNGFYVQEAILRELAERKGLAFRRSTPDEESQGIDGYVGNVAYSVKPDTYKTMNRLPESIGYTMIYYSKTKTGLKIELEE
jgi:hypothetical protein